MIEITHKQAQNLLRQGLDKPLPDAQWAMLQSHLENCAECTAYRERLAESQRGLAHALRLRWSSARGPRPGAAQYLVQRREGREKRRLWLTRASRYGLVLLLVAAFLVYRSVTAPRPQPAPTALSAEQGAEPRPTSTPVITFRGLVAYEENLDGNAEIMLLNASGGQVDRANLTGSPFAETAPAWSPDGEWIAFLSDRSGKKEVYVMTVAGSRLTQITASPGIEWQGPLEWSYDGSYLALSGRRANLGGDAFLYLVPLDGEQPRALAYTRGALPWARFSPTAPMLAFPVTYQNGGLRVINTQTGWFGNVTQEDTNILGMQFVHPEAFDWSLGGTSLVYIAEGGPGSAETLSRLRLSPDIDQTGGAVFSGSGADNIASEDRAGAFRAVTVVPNSLQVASLENIDGCWTIRLDHAYNRLVAPRRLEGLCVEGGLTRANWTGEGNGLVLLARRPVETQAAIYAVGLPVGEDGAPSFEKLSEVSLIPGEDDLPPGPDLNVRKIGRRLAINPKAAVPPGEPAPAAPPPIQGADDWIYYTAALPDGNGQIFRARPDGTQPEALTPAENAAHCPSASYGATASSGATATTAAGGTTGRVAYRGILGTAQSPRTEIFVMDADGQNGAPITNDVARDYDCPVISPDGARVAVFSFRIGETSLAILDTSGQAEPLYLPVDGSGLSVPLWLPDDPADPAAGWGRVLVVTPRARSPLRILIFDLRLPEGQRETPTELSMITGWDDIAEAAISPDGTRLAAQVVFFGQAGGRGNSLAAAQLRILGLDTSFWDETLATVNLSNFDSGTVGQGGLGWLDDETVGLARSTSLTAAQKSVFEIFATDPESGTKRLYTAARFEDLLYNAAWKTTGAVVDGVQTGQGAWAIFTAESGLWAMQFYNQLSGGQRVIFNQPQPVLIDPARIYEVEWK